MKVNFKSSSTNQPMVFQYLIETIALFAQEYDIDQYEAMDWILTELSGLYEYGQWLNRARVVTTAPYVLRNDAGDVFAMGLDIAEDELFTLMMMKIK